MPPRRPMVLTLCSWLASLGLVAVSGCEGEGNDDDGAPGCVSRDASACSPLYEPTWDRVYSQTIMPGCGTAGSACHAEPGAAGAAGGLVITGDMAADHSMLIDQGFVVPGDAACSDLMIRLDTEDTSLLMPPGSQPLPEGERCAVAQWIAGGASQ